MSFGEAKRVIFQPSAAELVTHSVVIITVLICATVLGLNKALDSGDILAIFSAAITGTATVAGARAGNRRQRTTDAPLRRASDPPQG